MEAARVLFISYYFYPYNGCGSAIRPIKLAKYFKREGLDLHVLCGGWESEFGDPSYARDVEGITLHVANPHPAPPTVEDNTSRPDHLRMAGKILRSVLPFPDNRFRHLPRLAREAARLIREHDLQLVLVSLPPNSTGLLIPMLKRHFPHLPMVLEFRDMWALDPIATPRHAWFRWCQKHLERWTLNHCERVISCTPGMTAWVRTQLKRPEHALTVLSGYDEDDFNFSPRASTSGSLRISYAGSTGGVAGPRTLEHIDHALKQVFQARPDLREGLEVEIIGHVDDATRQQISAFTHAQHFKLLGFMPHDQALEALSGADILLLNLFEAPGIEIVYPGKTWEYMRLGKPLWIASPRGILQELVTKTHRLGEWAEFTDAEGIAQALLRLLDDQEHWPQRYELGTSRYTQYACSTLFGDYARLLGELARQGETRRKQAEA